MESDIQLTQNNTEATESNTSTVAEIKTAISNVLEEMRQKALRYDGIDWLVSKLNTAKEDRADSLQVGKIAIAKDFYILPSDRSDYHILKHHKAVHRLMRMLQLEYREYETLSNHWKAELTRSKEDLEADEEEWSSSFCGLWVIPSRLSCSQLLHYANLIKEVEKSWIKQEEEKMTSGAKEIIAKVLGEEKKKLAPWEREPGPSTPTKKSSTPKKKESNSKPPSTSSTSKPTTPKTPTKTMSSLTSTSVQTPPKRKAEELLAKPPTSSEHSDKPKTKEDGSQQKLTNFFLSNQKQSKPSPAPLVAKKEPKVATPKSSTPTSKAQKLPENLETFSWASFDEEPVHIEPEKTEEPPKPADDDLDIIFSESRVRTYKRRRMSAPPVLPELRTSA